MTLQIFLQIFSSQVCNIFPIPRSAASRPREQSRHPPITASRSSGRVRPRERTSSSTPSAASPVVAHLRSALCGSRPATPCVLAALIRMGLLKIARLQRADIASSPPRAILPQHQRRAYGASEMRYCIITPSARRDSGGRMGHRRSTITRRFGDALLHHNPIRTTRQRRAHGA